MSSKNENLVLIAQGDLIRVVDLARDGQTFVIKFARTLQSATPAQDSFALADSSVLSALQELVSKQSWRGRSVFCLVGGTNVACQYFDLPLLKGLDLRAAVELKLGQQLHFDLAQAVIDIRKTNSDGGAINRYAVSVLHRDVSNAVIRATDLAGLKLSGISAAPAAIASLAMSQLSDRSGVAAVLHIDERQSTLVVLRDGAPCVNSELPIGVAEFTAALMRPIIAGENVLQLDEQKARQIRDQYGIPDADQEIGDLQITGERLMPLLETPLQKYAKQLTQWLTFASTCTGGFQAKSLLLIGPGAAAQESGAAIGGRLKLPVSCGAAIGGMIRCEAGLVAGEIESYAVAIAAAKTDELPNLLPPEVQRDRKLRRIRTSITLCGPVVAAAALAFAVLFPNTSGNVSSEIAAKRLQLEGMAQIVEENSKRNAQQARIERIEKSLGDFARSNPNWNGIFKELSVLLPRDLRVSQYVAIPLDGNLNLTVTASVVSGEGRTFDEIVSNTLLLLQRSAFFSRVEMISANRTDATPGQSVPASSGELSLRLDLVYPRSRAKA